VHQALADRDAAHPAGERAAAVVLVQAGEQLDEGVLREVLGHRAPRHESQRQRADRAFEGTVDFRLRGCIAEAGPLEHLGRQ
jgi:hypothetical protein